MRSFVDFMQTHSVHTWTRLRPRCYAADRAVRVQLHTCSARSGCLVVPAVVISPCGSAVHCSTAVSLSITYSTLRYSSTRSGVCVPLHVHRSHASAGGAVLPTTCLAVLLVYAQHAVLCCSLRHHFTAVRSRGRALRAPFLVHDSRMHLIVAYAADVRDVLPVQFHTGVLRTQRLVTFLYYRLVFYLHR